MGGRSVQRDVSRPEELRYLMSRYQVMRTRLQKQSGGWPCQVVSDRGEIELEIVDTAGTDPARTAEELCERYRSDPFDHELLVRILLSTERTGGR